MVLLCNKPLKVLALFLLSFPLFMVGPNQKIVSIEDVLMEIGQFEIMLWHIISANIH